MKNTLFLNHPPDFDVTPIEIDSQQVNDSAR